jgi:DNA-binding transcriptional MerR regulator/methylmalonyl-CoA mutase cobalamin-binding subunit
VHHSAFRPEHLLPVRLVAERTGLSPDVLRAWERRYGAVAPARSPGGQRWYTESDCARLRLLARAVEAGHNIASVVGLDDESLRAMVRSDDAAAMARQTPHALVSQPFLAEAMAAVEGLDGQALEHVLKQATLRLSMDELFDGVLTPLQRATGERWHRGTMSPAHEHLATAGVRRLLGWIIDQHAAAADAPAILVTTPSGQWHELGAKLAAATAATMGWNVVYLGPNLPAAVIAEAAVARKARVVALSLLYPEDDPRMDGELRELRQLLPPDVAIVVGGSGTAAYRPSLDGIGASVVTDLASLRRWMQARNPSAHA